MNYKKLSEKYIRHGEYKVIELIGLKWEEVDHCISCHSEEDHGYDMPEQDIPEFGEGHYAHLCCGAGAAYTEWHNKIEAAQQIVDEHLKNGKKVINIRSTQHPLECTIIYKDGSTSSITGKLAFELNSNKNPSPRKLSGRGRGVGGDQDY